MSDFYDYADLRRVYLEDLLKYLKHEEDFLEFDPEVDYTAASKLINTVAGYTDQIIFLQMVSEELYAEKRMLNEAYKSPSQYFAEWETELKAELTRVVAWRTTYKDLKDKLFPGCTESVVRSQNSDDMNDPLSDLASYDPTAR